MNSWNDIFNWLVETDLREVFFDNYDDVKQAIRFLKQQGIETIDSAEERINSWQIHSDEFPYLGMWWNVRQEMMIFNLRDDEDREEYDIIWYSQYPFAKSTVQINVDALDNLFKV